MYTIYYKKIGKNDVKLYLMQFNTSETFNN